jgi:CHAT domain-containing protein/Tfp pilus assembly protein PilF
LNRSFEAAEVQILNLAESLQHNPTLFSAVLKEKFSDVNIGKRGHLFMEIGHILSDSSFFDLELAVLLEALQSYRKAHDRTGESDCLINMGNAYRRLGEFSRAIASQEKACSIKKEIHDLKGEAGSLSNIGRIYGDLGESRKAIEYLTRALSIVQKRGYKEIELECYLGLATLYDDLRDFRNSIINYKAALSFGTQVGDAERRATICLNTAIAYDQLKQYSEALEYYLDAAALYSVANDKKSESGCYSNIGVDCDLLGEYDNAIKFYKKALVIKKALHDNKKEADCYWNIGVAYEHAGQFRKAIKYHNFALNISRRIKYAEGEFDCYFAMGKALHGLVHDQESIVHYKKALAIKKLTSDKTRQSDCYMNIGVVYSDLGQYLKALGYLQKALSFARAQDDESRECDCYTNIGDAYMSLGKNKLALTYHGKALPLYIRNGDKDGEAGSYDNIGNAFSSLGEYQRALDYHERALAIYKIIRNNMGQSSCYSNIGNIYDMLGQYETAINFHKRALDLASAQGDKRSECKCLLSLGNAYQGLNESHLTIRSFENALHIANEIEAKGIEESVCLASLGTVSFSLGKFRQCIDYSRKALPFFKQNFVETKAMGCMANIGAAYLKLGQKGKALSYLQQSLKIAQSVRDRYTESAIRGNIAETCYKDKPEVAYNHIKISLKLSTGLYESLLEERNKMGFQSSYQYSYQIAIPLCVSLSKYSEAFQYVQASKSRTFADLMTTIDLRPKVKVDKKLAQLLSEEKDLLQQKREMQNRSITMSGTYFDSGRAEQLAKRLTIIYDSLQKIDPRYVAMRRASVLSVKQVQMLLKAQGRSRILVEYFRSSEKVTIFVVDSEGLHVREVRVPKDEFYSAYLNFAIDSPANVTESIVNGISKLSKFFVEPISDFLAQETGVVFVPHNILHTIPLHVLLVHGLPIIMRHPVTYCPSTSLLMFFRNRRPRSLRTCSSFGVDFPWEAEDVAKIFDTNPLQDATKDIVLENLDTDVLHFSCHGFFNKKDPLSSGILLHDNKYPEARDVLTAREIFKLRLNAELVTLSACQTGMNEIKQGDEAFGLTRAFLYAGAASVLVTLWSVNALSTEVFMKKFYTELKNGKDKATALQLAQIALMEDKNHPEWKHPYYWAPFVLVGDWE